MARAHFEGDANAAWDAATVTLVPADVTGATALAMVGWRAKATVTTPAGVLLYEAEVTGDATDDTLDEVGTALAAALATAGGVTATYTGATQVLVAATGTGTDDLGDHTLAVEFRPPASYDDAEGAPIAGFVASITHEGAAAANLEATFAADTFIVPVILQTYKQIA
jgi:hypothetical protein